MTEEPMVVVEHLSRSYGSGDATVHALRDVSLAIPRGSPWFTDYHRYDYSVETARGLLREAGAAPHDLDMLVTSEYPETVTAAQIIAVIGIQPLEFGRVVQAAILHIE